MDKEAVFIAIIVFVLLAFLPIVIKGKNNKNGTIVTILTSITAIAVFPSIFLQLELGQTFILILWIIALILSIAGRDKIRFEISKENETEEFSSKTNVENVKIKKDNENAWTVTGMIRNNSPSNIKGSVKIKFLTSNSDIIHTTKTRVNDGDILKPGQAGVFDYYTEPKNFNGVTDFDIKFYQQ